MRSEVGGFLRAELPSNASAKELRTHPPLNQVGTALQAQYSRTTLLYLTLVRDGALPGGFQQEFESLASAIETGAERALRQSAKRTDTDAVMYLHSLEQNRKETEQADKTAADQFIQAASLKPRRFRARYMTAARRDSEEAERNRWIFTLSENIKGTATPMGKMLTDRSSWWVEAGEPQPSGPV